MKLDQKQCDRLEDLWGVAQSKLKEIGYPVEVWTECGGGLDLGWARSKDGDFCICVRTEDRQVREVLSSKLWQKIWAAAFFDSLLADVEKGIRELARQLNINTGKLEADLIAAGCFEEEK